jgi:vacuolar-type H+-ATPase subunit H
MTTSPTAPLHERNHPVTTAPARPILLGPDGQALPTTVPAAADDWTPVRTTDNAIVWEKPRAVADVQPAAEDAQALAGELLEDARTEAKQLLEDARAQADQITAEAKSLRTRTLAAATSEASQIRDRAAADAARAEDRARKLDVWMARAVIVGAVGLTASGEYSLARLAHFPREVAWLLPFVIDIYVIQAFRRHRDIAQAITLTIAANVVYHLAAAGMFGVSTDGNGKHHATWWLIAMVASIASVILWRMHVITAPPRKKKPRPGTGTDASSEPVLSSPQKTVPAASDNAVPDNPRAGTGTGCEQQERTPVPPTGTALSTAPAQAVSTAPVPAATAPSVPALRAVPAATRRPVQKHRSTAPKTRRSTGRSTAPKTGSSTASFEEHVDIARGWLAKEPGLSGADIGKRLGTGDSYGRRVKRAATGQTSP